MNQKRFATIGFLILIIVIAGALGYFAFVRTPSQGVSEEPASSLQPTTAYNYYVSPTGNDANDGSASRPWRTINHAAQNVQPGDTVGVLPGTYNEAFYEDGEYRAGVYSNRSGTENAPIRFISVEKWGALVRTNAPNWEAIYSVWDNRGDYVTIQGFDISGTNASIGIYNDALRSRIIGNYIHDLPVPEIDSQGREIGQGGGGIVHGTSTSTSYSDIIGNVIIRIGQPDYDPRSGGGHVHGIYLHALGGKISNNIVSHSSAWGIAATGGGSYIISNNLIFKNKVGGMGFSGYDPSWSHEDGEVLNFSNTTVSNNIIVDNGMGIYELALLEESREPLFIGPGNRYLNNLVWENISPHDRVEYGIIVSRGSVVQGTVTANPSFVNYRGDGTGDYRLRAGSPAIDAGTSEGAPNLDLDGVPRPQGARFDIGPYERK